jgi:hypothetical protein
VAGSSRSFLAASAAARPRSMVLEVEKFGEAHPGQRDVEEAVVTPAVVVRCTREVTKGRSQVPNGFAS